VGTVENAISAPNHPSQSTRLWENAHVDSGAPLPATRDSSLTQQAVAAVDDRPMARPSRGLPECSARRMPGFLSWHQMPAMGQYPGVIRDVSKPCVNHPRLARLESCAVICFPALGKGIVFLDFGTIFNY